MSLYNPTVNDECGLLVDGFDTSPFVMMPYNPPYYLDLYEKHGLKTARDLFVLYSRFHPSPAAHFENRRSRETHYRVKPSQHRSAALAIRTQNHS